MSEMIVSISGILIHTFIDNLDLSNKSIFSFNKVQLFMIMRSFALYTNLLNIYSI